MEAVPRHIVASAVVRLSIYPYLDGHRRVGHNKKGASIQINTRIDLPFYEKPS
jgi:hypothetical protein